MNNPWSKDHSESPVDPAVGIGAAAVGTRFFMIRHR